MIMSRILRWMSHRPSSYLFWRFFGAYALLTVFGSIKALSFLMPACSAGALAIIYFYPTVLIFGFPKNYSGVLGRCLTVGALAVVGAACVAMAFGDDVAAPNPSPLFMLLGAGLSFLVMSPFFIAIHVLRNVRRDLGTYKVLDSFGAWAALMFFCIGGVFFLHPSVSSAVQASDTLRKRIPCRPHGCYGSSDAVEIRARTRRGALGAGVGWVGIAGWVALRILLLDRLEPEHA